MGDLMSSICLLRYKCASKLMCALGGRYCTHTCHSAMDEAIEEIARDYNANWMTAVEALDDDK